MSTDNPHNNCLTIGNPLPSTILKPVTIGCVALEKLANQIHFVVRGVTSKGVFLEIDNHWIVYLSSEKYKGPLNINLPGQSDRFAKLLSVNTHGLITNEQTLQFPQMVSILTKGVQVWSAKKTKQLNMAMRYLDMENQLLVQVRKEISNKNDLFVSILALLGKDPRPISTISDPEIFNQTTSICTAFKDKNLRLFEQAVDFFIGRGAGLTPSGDDFLLGLVYSLYRFDILYPFRLDTLKDSITQAANKTTLISANLIRCAAQGEVDERLLNAFDYLITNRYPPPEVVSGIMDWGSSSGVDALAGMSLGYYLFLTNPNH